VRPKCSTCSDLGFECEYTAQIESNQRNRGWVPAPFHAHNIRNCCLTVTSRFTDTLANRLGLVEDALYALSSRVDRHDVHIAAGRVANILPTAVRHPTGVSSPQEASHDVVPPQDTTDGMGAVNFSEEENTGFFGPSSNIAFTRQIVRAVKAAMKNQPTTLHQGARNYHDEVPLQSHMLHVSRPPSPLHQRLDSDEYRAENPIFLGLPPDHECLNLIRQYFDRTGVLFPYINEETFLATYDEFKATRFRKVRRSWLGLLNMLLAMATRTAVSSKLSGQEKEEQSDTYFVRAWRLCET